MDYKLAFALRDKYILSKLIKHLQTDHIITREEKEAVRRMLSSSKRITMGDSALPCRYAVIIGDGGSGKTTAVTNLKSLLSSIVFTGPTHESAFAFSSAMKPSLQSSTELKDHYPTMHKFLNVNVDETDNWLKDIFSEHVTDRMHFGDYSSYCMAHKVKFAEMANLVFEKFKKFYPNAVLPEHYKSIKTYLLNRGLSTDHKTVLGIINDAGKIHLVPPLLRYSYFVFDECGRFPVAYILFFMFGYYWFRNLYGADDDEKIKIICIGSVTQSNVIVGEKIALSSHARISPLAVINKVFWLPKKDVYMKIFKFNRRRQNGNMQRSLLLSMFVEQLESGERIDPDLALKFQNEIGVPRKEFENIERFKGHTFLAPRHSDLTPIRDALEDKNKDKIRVCKEYLFVDIPDRSEIPLFYHTSDLSKEIQSKFKSVYKDDSFRYSVGDRYFNRFSKEEEKVYTINRKFIIDRLVVLTHFHVAKIEKVSGLIEDVWKMIEFLKPCIVISNNCIRFFAYVLYSALDDTSGVMDSLDDIVSDTQYETNNKRKRDSEETNISHSMLLQFDILLQQLRAELDRQNKKRDRIYVIAPPGVNLIFDANKYELEVLDFVEYSPSETCKRISKTSIDVDSAIVLRFMNCLSLTMNRKRIRIKLPVSKRDQRKFDNEDEPNDDVDEYNKILSGIDPDIPKKGFNGSAYVFPLAPIDIATFAYTQGRTISHPVVVAINRNQDAYSVITALTRSEYPDSLTVASDNLSTIFPLDLQTVDLVQYIEKNQTDLI